MLERFNSKRRDLRRKRKEQEEGPKPSEEPPAPRSNSNGSGAAAAPRRASPSSPLSTSGALLEQHGEEENMQWLASSGLLDALWTEGWEASPLLPAPFLSAADDAPRPPTPAEPSLQTQPRARPRPAPDSAWAWRRRR
jgi:hypothetical protein